MPKIALINDGKDGEKASDFGLNGMPGSDAKPVNVTLKPDTTSNCIVIQEHSEASRATIPIDEIDKYLISLSAKGGKGGDGGVGMPGQNGVDGYSGTRASEGISGTDGGAGSDGWPGSNGGNGASGGNGADINVYVDPDNLELLMLLEPVQVAGGAGGKAGSGGFGGIGGRGGLGGSELYWKTYEDVREIEYYTDFHGRPAQRPTWRTIEYPHYTPGGRDGISGYNGMPGLCGLSGVDGNSGTFRIHVGANAYPGRYNLTTTNYALADSDDGVIEPGETLNLEALTFQNNGFLHTPTKQQVDVFIRNTPWIEFPGPNAAIVKSLLPGEKYTLVHPLAFSIKSNFKIIPNQVPRETVALKWSAKLRGVNKLFSDVEEQGTTFEVRYPVELSLIKGPDSIKLDEEAPLAVQIKNISSKDIGSTAADARTLKLLLGTSSSYGSRITWKSLDGTYSGTLGTEIAWDAPLLAAKSKSMFSGTLKFSSEVPFLTTIPISVKLVLGSKANPRDLITISESTAKLKLGHSYQPNPTIDYVLAVHSGNTIEQINQWQNIATKLFGLAMPIWDVSSYSGIDYFHKRKDGGSFATELKGKVLIILNNSYLHGGQSKRIVSDELSPAEIYKAAKEANIATYIVGSDESFDPYKLNILFEYERESHSAGHIRTPLLATTHSEERTVTISARNPAQNKMIFKEKVEELKETITKTSPGTQMFIVYQYKPKRIATGCLTDKWDLGSISVISGLSLVHTKIAIRQKPGSAFNTVDNNDVYNMLKILPFASKLACLGRSEDYKLEVIQAILSDLADEQAVWRREDWSGRYPKDTLEINVCYVRILSNFNFGPIVQKKSGAEAVLQMLMFYEKLINSIPLSLFDYCMLYRRGRILTAICQTAICHILQRYFSNITEPQLNTVRTGVINDCKRRGWDDDSLLQNFRRPRNDDTTKYIGSGGVPALVLNKDKFVTQPIIAKNIAKSTYLFSGSSAATDRKAAIASFEKQIA